MLFGADAVQMGTAFLTCHESGINTHYKNALLTTPKNNTTLTRGIKNKFIERTAKYHLNPIDYPIQNALTREMRKEAAKQGDTEFMSLWAGESAHLCKAWSVGEMMGELVGETC